MDTVLMAVDGFLETVPQPGETDGASVLSFRCRAPPRGEAGESRRMEVLL
ncbi:hypothetical protein ACFQ0G_53985 [Streptomyces chiangmaiensis]